MCSYLSTFKKFCLFCGLACLTSLVIWGVAAVPTQAHRPHDVVPQVVMSPDYGEDSTVYILARNNLLRSRDKGETWLRLNQGLDNFYGFNDLTIAPGSPQTLYASTTGSGIYRSQDNGDTWKTANRGLDNLELQWVEVAPTNADLALTQTQDGRLYRTEDSGEQWKTVSNDSQATTLTFTSSNDALLGDDQGQLWQSTDAGVTWQAIAQLTDAGAIQKIAIAADAATAPTIYVGTALDGVYRSTDGGQSFTPWNDGLSDLRIEDVFVASDGTLIAAAWEAGASYWDAEQDQWVAIADGLSRDKQAYETNVPHFYDLAVSPDYAEDGELFLGGFNGLFRSQDQGQQWSELETISSGAIIAMDVSPTFAKDQTLAVATYVGELYISRDAGNSWQAIHQDLHLPRFTFNFRSREGDQDPRRFFDIGLSSNFAADDTLFSSILYTKVLRSTNGGQDWSIEQFNNAVRGVSLAISPDFANDGTIISTNQKGVVFRSRDGGETFPRVGELDKQPGNDSPSTVISPNFANDQTLFNTGLQGVYKSTDAGETWELLTANTELESAKGAQIAIAPNFTSDPTVFVGTKDGLFRSQDGGATWERLQREVYGPNPFIEAIALSPNYANDQTVMASVRGMGLFKSEDGGATFINIGDADLAIARVGYVPSAGRALQFSPNYAEDNTLFGFGTVDASVYRSTDGGNNWEVLPLPRLRIGEIPPLGTAGTVGLFFEFNQRRMVKLAGLLLVVGVIAGGLRRLSDRRVITFPTQAVQGIDASTLAIPAWLKITVIALVVLRLVFSLSYLTHKPYNADEVRGFYRLSGYREATVRQDAFRGQILTSQDLINYQLPSGATSPGDALASLADYPEHPPLYDMVTRYWLRLWRDPVAARVLSVLLGIVCIPCAYWLCVELFQSAWAGWVAMALFSLSPYHLLLAQGAREYSLWTILLLTSSTLLLRSLRLGQRRDWIAYGLTVAVGLYSHLFFAFMLIAHGLYVLLFEWRRWRSRLLPFVLSAGTGVVLFGPWLWVVATRLDTIEENTQWVRGRDSTLINIINSTLDRMGDLFFNLNGASSLDRGVNFLLLGLIFLAFCCLIRWNSSRVWLFLLLPVGVTLTLLAIPDLLSGGGRSLQSRYLVPALLPVTLGVAFFLANAMRRSKHTWERLTWTGVFTGLLVLNLLSSVTIARAVGLDYLEQGRTASVINRDLAPLIDASANPLVLNAATHSFVLALSYDVHDNVQFQSVQDLAPSEWSTVIDLPQAASDYSDVFVYFPNDAFLAFLEETYSAELEDVYEKKLYRLRT